MSITTPASQNQILEARRKQAQENMSAQYDIVPPVDLKCRYLICSTERSGSSLLADMLANTGLAGCPMEYFNKLYIETYLASQSAADRSLLGYLAHLERRRISPNGIFGVKAHLRQILNSLGEDPGPKLPAFLSQFHKLIYIVRRDRLGQAISLSRARATGHWSSKYKGVLPVPEGPPTFDPRSIARALSDIITENHDWRYILAGQGDRVRTIHYEDLAASPEPVLRDVLSWLGADVSSLGALATSLARQRDSHSDDLKRLFKEYIENGVD